MGMFIQLTSLSSSVGLDDPYQHGRGVALADFNRDGKVDLIYGNWNGPHRLYLQVNAGGRIRFRVSAIWKREVQHRHMPGMSWALSRGRGCGDSDNKIM